MKFVSIALLAALSTACAPAMLGSAKSREAFIYAVCNEKLEGEVLTTSNYGVWVCTDNKWIKR